MGRALVLQVGVDPFFEFAAAIVGGVEAETERVLWFSPGDAASDPNARQGEQCERDFQGLARTNFFRTSDRHPA